MAEKKTKAKPLYFRGHPVMRKDSIIYYGSMADKYIIMMQVLESENQTFTPAQAPEGEKPLPKELQMAKKISIELQHTDPNITAKQRVIRKSEKKGMYYALDIASIWLERALSGKM